jgi:hypothetical protein
VSRAISVMTVVVGVGVSGYLIGALVKSVIDQRRGSDATKIWPNFGLSITFAILFFVSWMAQAFAEWGVFREEQLAHGQPARLADYVVSFGQSTFENWQSEFLQLFSFVVLSAVLIHRGSAESKDGTDRIEQAVKRIEQRLDRLDETTKTMSREGR